MKMTRSGSDATATPINANIKIWCTRVLLSQLVSLVAGGFVSEAGDEANCGGGENHEAGPATGSVS
jgi:hypothetical protein